MLQLPLLLLLMFLSTSTATFGGEKAFFDTVQFAPNVTHRQNVCDRYERFREKTVDLKDALEGLKLNVLLSAYDGAYFNYDPETGINKEYPGLAAIILDELARRGKFTWRDSFGVNDIPGEKHSWKDLLLWSIETYDLQVDWWAQNLERMNLGVGFFKEWYDASIILISIESPEEISEEIRWWNWLRPYDADVWVMTVLTVFVSGIVYQILEWYADGQRDRTMWDWWQQNFYLSAINFTQAYEYQPKTFSTRLFGISMAIWALVMTATYTANLASLLVDRKPPPVVAQTMDEVVVFGNRICTWEGTWSDDFVRLNHPGATRITKKTVLELYQGLQNGDCEFAAEAVASWSKNKALKEYNPHCNLYWVGGDRKANEVYASFVGKVDSGDKCSGLIRDVLDLHMHDMIEDGFVTNVWGREFARTADINCDTYRPELAAVIDAQLNEGNSTASEDDATRRHLLRANPQEYRPTDWQRRLKAAKGAVGGAVAAASASGGGESEATKLKLEQMIGTFMFHWALMAIALVAANVNALYKRYGEEHATVVTAKVRNSLHKTMGKNGGTMGSSTKRISEMSEDFDVQFAGNFEPSSRHCDTSSRHHDTSSRIDHSTRIDHPPRVERPTDHQLREQLEDVRRNQSDMKQSQSQMEQYQFQMQQAQAQMLQEQRKLQAQIQALLAEQKQQKQPWWERPIPPAPGAASSVGRPSSVPIPDLAASPVGNSSQTVSAPVAARNAASPVGCPNQLSSAPAAVRSTTPSVGRPNQPASPPVPAMEQAPEESALPQPPSIFTDA